MTRKELDALKKEYRLLGYRYMIGTLTQDDHDRLTEVKALLAQAPAPVSKGRT